MRQGRLEKVFDIEKDSAIKCCTFGASSLYGRQLATGNFAGSAFLNLGSNNLQT